MRLKMANTRMMRVKMINVLEQREKEKSSSPQIDLLSPQPDLVSKTNDKSNEDESDDSTASSCEEKTPPSCPEGVLLSL